jgi:general secretion pathway protein I
MMDFAGRTMERTRRSISSDRRRRCTHRGFTLVEVMVALVIISIAMVTLLSTHAISARTYAEAKALAACSMLAQQKLAELEAGELPPAGETSGGFEDNENYQWTLSIRETELEALREVTLEVSLIPAKGLEKTEGVPHVIVTTSLADLGKPEEGEEGEQEKG